MLAERTEAIALVAHLLDNEVTGEQSSGLRPQNALTGATTTRPVDGIDPSNTVTVLTIHLERSGVFATTRVLPAYSLAQVISSIVGLTVGILGGVKAAFAVFERLLGERLAWLVGAPGLVATEADALDHMRRAKIGNKGMGTGKSKQIDTTKEMSGPPMMFEVPNLMSRSRDPTRHSSHSQNGPLAAVAAHGSGSQATLVPKARE